MHARSERRTLFSSSQSLNHYFPFWIRRLFLLALALSTRRSYPTRMPAFRRFFRRRRPVHECRHSATIQHFIICYLRVLNVRFDHCPYVLSSDSVLLFI